ncbi:MAG: CoA transferase [Actinomycetes bacterium]
MIPSNDDSTPWSSSTRPLSGIRVIEVSLLGAAAATTTLADLGADVIKVEPPGGDYGRKMTWPLIEGDSLLFLHCNRGKRSIEVDLKEPAGVAVFKDLIRDADVVVEAMRPGALDRRGLGYEVLRAVNPSIVHLAMSGYGSTGPYRNLPSHGVAFDSWAGIVQPEPLGDDRYVIPDHVSIGLNAAPLYGAIGILAGVLAARATGVGCSIELSQAESAAAFDWLRIETWRAYERPETEVTGNPTDSFERREPGTAGMRDGVRYQFYKTADGHILFMASERSFWRNFCAGINRIDLFERWPGEEIADHARGNEELRRELISIFRSETTAYWLEFGDAHNTAIAPVNSSKTLPSDPHFVERTEWLPSSTHRAEMLPVPLRFSHSPSNQPGRAPHSGEHSEEVLREVLGYDDDRVQQLLSGDVIRQW